MTVKDLKEALCAFPDDMTVKVSCDRFVRDAVKVTMIVDMDTNITSVEIADACEGGAIWE